MLKEGRNIIIQPSSELSSMRMGQFVGSYGIIEVDLTNESRKNKGYMVRIPNSMLNYNVDNESWFIPEESVNFDV